MDEKELVPLQTEISNLEKRALEVEITKAEEYTQAVDFVAELKDAGSRVKKAKESVTKPLNEALKKSRELFSPLEEQFANAESILKGKILSYKRKVDEEARLQEEKIAKKVDAGRLKFENAEKKIGAIERVETATKGLVGEVQIRKVRKVRIISEKDLPREYLVPDMVAIRRDALAGKVIAGTEVYEEEVVASSSL